MKIIHFGDLHVWDLSFPLSDPFYFKRYLGLVNLLTNRRKKFPKEVGEKVVQHILEQDADLVVFSGDFTTASLKTEFAKAAELMQPLQKKWGDRFFVIPGNHDRYTGKATAKDWFAKSFPYGEIKHVRAMELNDNLVVIGYDASEPFLVRSNGYFSSVIGNKLTALLEKYQKSKVVLVGHYPVDYPKDVKIDSHHEMIHREHLAKILEKYPPILYLHGHKHARWRIGNAVNCGSAGMLSDNPLKQAGFAEITLKDNSIESVTSVSLQGEIFQRESFDVDFS